VRILIFDLDGTLVDSSRDLADAVNAARACIGLPPHALDRVISYIGHGARELVRKSIQDSHPAPPPELLEEVLGYFREHYAQHLLDQTRPYPGVRETLEQLAASPARFTLAVLTNKPLRFTQPILEGLDLARFFPYVWGEDSLGAKKPDPIGIHTLARETGAAPHNAVMVGDSDTDVLTARNAGAWACGVTYGLGSHLLELQPPDILIDALPELLQCIDSSAT
jgi:phosphoglycolate phosphatase